MRGAIVFSAIAGVNLVKCITFDGNGGNGVSANDEVNGASS